MSILSTLVPIQMVHFTTSSYILPMHERYYSIRYHTIKLCLNSKAYDKHGESNLPNARIYNSDQTNLRYQVQRIMHPLQ